MKKNLEKKLGAEYNDFYCWSYCPQDKNWYEDGVEELPQPSFKSYTGRFDIIPLIGVWSDPEAIGNDREEIKEFVEYLFTKKYKEDLSDYSGCWTQITFIGDKYRASGSFSDEGLLNLDDMIRNFKENDEIRFYILESCRFKFVTWKKSEKLIRFTIFDYNDNDDTFLRCIFDITAEKELIISKLESIIETWKEVILERIRYQESISGMKFVNTKKIPVIDYFFPQFKVK